MRLALILAAGLGLANVGIQLVEDSDFRLMWGLGFLAICLIVAPLTVHLAQTATRRRAARSTVQSLIDSEATLDELIVELEQPTRATSVARQGTR